MVGAGLMVLLAACDAGAGAPRGQAEAVRADGGSSSAEDAEATPAGSGEATPAETAEPEPESESESELEPTPEPTPDEGSRENPFHIGDDVGNDDWSIVLEEPYEAWGEVQAENQFNDPPGDGMEFWMLPVSATYTGTATGDPYWDMEFGFVSDDGRTYDDNCGVVPDALRDVGEMYPDAEASANICLEVPEDAPGLWTVAASFTEPVFFAVDEG